MGIDKSQEVRWLIDEIGRREIMRTIGVSRQSVSQAIRLGRIPLRWRDDIERLAAERGVPVDRTLFGSGRSAPRVARNGDANSGTTTADS